MSADSPVAPPRRRVRSIPFENGDRMDQPTFHRLYLRTPEKLKAELLGGIVFMASPVNLDHSEPDSLISLLLGGYRARTPGTKHFGNGTVILGAKDEPQPDQILYVRPEFGGLTRIPDRQLHGPPELVVEVAMSSRSRDLNLKRRRYYLAGIPEYLVVLPKHKEVRWFVHGGDDYMPMPPDPQDGRFKSRVFGGLWLDANALFAEDLAAMQAALERGLASPEHAATVARLAAAKSV